MRLGLIASQPHYLDHLVPIWRALDEDERGWVALPSKKMAAYAERLGTIGTPRKDRGRVDAVLVAGYNDYKAAPGRVIYCEHGIGQTYVGAEGHSNYAGGRDRDKAALILCPTRPALAANRKAHPKIPSVLVGIPRLDQHLNAKQRTRKVVITGHWDCQIVPETRSALSHFGAQIFARPESTIGHAHPRNRQLHDAWARHGIQMIRRLDDVLALRPPVFIGDNTSAIYEAAALDIPVVLLNAPWYRRGIEHGIRFWSCANVGIQVDEQHRMWHVIDVQMDDPHADTRREVIAGLFGDIDGRASERAVFAIREALC